MKYNKRENGISPVIAIVIVVSIVVLAAILYVMAMESACTHREIPPPLGLNQERGALSSVNILISSVPHGATTDEAIISYTHNGTHSPVTATLYNATGTLVANYTNGAFDEIIPLTRGMTLVVSPSSGSVSVGDVIIISSSQNTFSTSAVYVS